MSELKSSEVHLMFQGKKMLKGLKQKKHPKLMYNRLNIQIQYIHNCDVIRTKQLQRLFLLCKLFSDEVIIHKQCSEYMVNFYSRGRVKSFICAREKNVTKSVEDSMVQHFFGTGNFYTILLFQYIYGKLIYSIINMHHAIKAHQYRAQKIAKFFIFKVPAIVHP